MRKNTTNRGVSPKCYTRLPPLVLEAIDQDAAAEGTTRAAVLRRIAIEHFKPRRERQGRRA